MTGGSGKGRGGRRQRTANFRTGYMDDAVFDLQTTLRTAVANLKPHAHKFDTLVGTGFSGGLLIPALALRLRKNFVLIRKETDDSHHGSGRLLGTLGTRWVFVDDFVSTGKTRQRVIDKILEASIQEQHQTTLVGNYYYGRHIEFKWQEERSWED